MNYVSKEKLKKLFYFLNEKNEFYSQLFERNKIDLNNDLFEELMKLPIMEKETIRYNLDTYYSKTNEEIKIERTSGSVGIPLICKKSKSERANAAINVWEKRRRIDKEISPQNYFHFFGNSKGQIGDFINVNQEQLINFFNNILKRKYRWISGPVSTILAIAKLLEKQLVKNDCIKFVELFGEYCSKEQRNYIEKMFDCKTVVHYGTRETWCIAYECEHRKLHIQDNLFYVEIKANKGEKSGEIVVTSYYNKVMPFVRYNLKDIGYIEETQCKCGSKSPCLYLQGGRTADMIYGYNLLGNNFFNRVINQVFEEGYDSIDKFKVIQVERNLFIMYIVKGKNYSNSIENIIISTTREKLGEQITINFIYVSDLKFEASGKFKNFECQLNECN